MDDLNNINNLGNVNSNDDFLEIDKLESLQKKLSGEKGVDEEGRLVRIEALLHALIATLKKLIDEPDPMESKIIDLNDRLNEIAEQNKIMAKTLLLIVNKLKDLEKKSMTSPTQFSPSHANITHTTNVGSMNSMSSSNFPGLPPLPPKK